MTPLTLAKLAEIEAAAAKADTSYWDGLSRYLSDMSVDATPSLCNLHMITLCDPATVAALCKVTRAAYNVHVLDHNAPTDDALEEVLRDAGLIEP